MPPWFKGIAIMGAAALFLTGCSSADEPGGTKAATDAAIPSFSYAGASPASLDAAKNLNVADLGKMSMFTDSLERFTQAGEPSALLATSVTEPDDKTIVYTLRPDVKFSNGDPLTVDDVVWSLKHVAAKGAQTATVLGSVDTINATAANEVTVTLKAVDPTVRTALATVGKIQSKKAGEAAGDKLGSASAVPVGTGPYVVSSYTPSNITMERNDNYWGTPPAVDKLTFTTVEDNTSAQLALRSGDVQGASVTDLNQTDKWEAIQGASLYETPTMVSNAMAFDTTDPLMGDIHFRKALTHSIDREGVLKAAFGGKGSLMRAYLPDQVVLALAPTKEEGESFLASLPTYDFDLKAAKAELDQSPYSGQVVPLYFVPEIPWSKVVALNLQENLKTIGVKAEPKSISRNDWLANIYAKTLKTPSPLPLQGTAVDARVLHDVIGDGGYNVAKWNSKAASDAQPQLYDKAKGWPAVKAALADIAEQVPYAPLVTPQNILVLGDGYTYTTAPTERDMSNGAYIELLRSTK